MCKYEPGSIPYLAQFACVSEAIVAVLTFLHDYPQQKIL